MKEKIDNIKFNQTITNIPLADMPTRVIRELKTDGRLIRERTSFLGTQAAVQSIKLI